MSGLSDLNSFRRVPFERGTYSCYWSVRSFPFESEKTLLSSRWWFFFNSLFISLLQLKMQVKMFLYYELIHSDFYKKQMFWVLNSNHIVKKHPLLIFFFLVLPLPFILFSIPLLFTYLFMDFRPSEDYDLPTLNHLNLF